MWFGKQKVYLDWAASAPVAPVATAAFMRVLGLYGNPSSPHSFGVKAKEALEEARATIAKLCEVKQDGVIFTSGASEANNLALTGRVIWLRKQGQQKNHLLYMPSSHASVIETVRALKGFGVETEELRLKDGVIDIADLTAKLRPETCLVVIDAVCGETGTRYDTRAVRNALEAYARKTGSDRPLLHVDASQAPLALPFDLTRLAADMVTLDAQKVGGIRGAGALCKRSQVKIAPITYGGGQEQGLRPGTEPVALVTAFAAALSDVSKRKDAFRTRAEKMRAALVTTIQKELPDAVVNQGREGVPHILNLSLPGRDTDYLVMLLDKEGFAVSTKSACETDSDDGSRAVIALTGDPELAKVTLRVSWGPTTSASDLGRLSKALIRSVRFMDRVSL